MTLTLKEQWDALKEGNPRLRLRDAALQLGVTEADLVNLNVGHGNTLLRPVFQEILCEVEQLGYVMALTRNDHCVHERKGVYRNVTFNGNIGLAVNPDIDLRLFMGGWKFGFAVNEGGRLSLQFFGKDGEAVHKIYVTDQTDVAAYHALVAKYKAKEQEQTLEIVPSTGPKEEKPYDEIDIPAFQQAWLNLEDTHAFHGMLLKHKVSRRQAMHLAPSGHAQPLRLDRLKQIMQAVSERDVEIMVFTGSAGCIQIHTGKAKKLVQTGPWFNVLDPEFNLHLREDGIASLWIVKKPTVDGPVHSMEVFDKDGGMVVQFFGKRKPGVPESEEWRTVLQEFGG